MLPAVGTGNTSMQITFMTHGGIIPTRCLKITRPSAFITIYLTYSFAGGAGEEGEGLFEEG